ncbi:MAG: L,D-transpeptidase family protein [Anaerolineae bacterium]|nr:L,D-transpeptidase family protein [Anaerolineae bacterium]
MQHAMPRTRKRKSHTGLASALPWLIVGVEMGLVIVMLVAAIMGFGAVMFYSTGRVLPGVSSFGVSLGTLNVDDAAEKLRTAWMDGQPLVMRDGARTWRVSPQELGLQLDAVETALRAQRVGRGNDGLGAALGSVFGGYEVNPAITIDLAQARAGLESLVGQINIPAQNATIRIAGAEVEHVDAFPGRELDIERLLSDMALPEGAGVTFAEGVLDLPMIDTQPQITDAHALMAEAQRFVGQAFRVHAYDPFTDQKVVWTVDPDTFASWLAADLSDDGRQVILSLGHDGPAAYLESMKGTLGAGRTLEIEESVGAMQAALAAGQLDALVRVRSLPTQYTVQHGDTFMAIARQFGIPAVFLTEANPGVDPSNLHAGDVVNIPSRDIMLPLPIVPDKRIVIDIGDLRMYVYEKGELLKNWGTSTGIDSSPTLPGVFQIRTHEELAYASSWDLWMPHFMGVYEAAPGFMNGIHGLPKRGGHTLVWRDALGSYRTSYGCIILGLEEAEWLFNWAQEGVIVEIRD